MKPHPYKPGPMQNQIFGDPVEVCNDCCYEATHLNHDVPENPRKLLKELFEVMRLEIEAQRVWMTPERDDLMLRCAKLLGTTVR